MSFLDSHSAARRTLVAIGLVAIAAIHVLDLPGKFEDGPTYLAVGYIGVILVSLILVERVIVKGSRFDFAASAALAASVFVGFVINRTIGMPGATDDINNWLEPLGLLSLRVEGFVVWQSLAMLVGLSSKNLTSDVDGAVRGRQAVAN